MERSRLRASIRNAANRNAAFVIKNAKVVNVFTGEILSGDVAMRDGVILGVGSYTGREEYDAGGAYLCPGLIDSHFHGCMADLVLLERGTLALRRVFLAGKPVPVEKPTPAERPGGR